MNGHLRKVLSVILAAVMCFSLLPAYSFAEEEQIADHEHEYEENVVAPTCTEQGYTEHICKICSDTFIDGYTDPTGHLPETVAEKPATCEADGTCSGERCSVCGEILSGCETIPAAGHVPSDAEEIKPSEGMPGRTAGHVCSVCGAVIDGCEEIPFEVEREFEDEDAEGTDSLEGMMLTSGLASTALPPDGSTVIEENIEVFPGNVLDLGEADVWISEGCTITVYGQLNIRSVVEGPGSLVFSDNGRCLFIGENADINCTVSPENPPVYRVLESDVIDFAALKQAVDSFVNGNYDEAWLNINSNIVVVDEDYVFPEGCFLNLDAGVLEIAEGHNVIFRGDVNLIDAASKIISDEGSNVVFDFKCSLNYDDSRLIRNGGGFYCFNGYIAVTSESELRFILDYIGSSGDYKTVNMVCDVALTGDITIPENSSIIIHEGAKLTVNEGVSLLLRGHIEVLGELEVNGEITGEELGDKIFVHPSGTISGQNGSVDRKTVFNIQVGSFAELKSAIDEFENGGYDKAAVEVFSGEIVVDSDFEIPEGVTLCLGDPDGKITVASGVKLVSRRVLIQGSPDRTALAVENGACAVISSANFVRDDSRIYNAGAIVFPDDPRVTNELELRTYIDYADESHGYVEVVNDLELTYDFVIPEFVTVKILSGVTLTVPAGVNLEYNGSVEVDGTLCVDGTAFGSGKILRATWGTITGENAPASGSIHEAHVNSADLLVYELGSAPYFDEVRIFADGELEIHDYVVIPENVSLILDNYYDPELDRELSGKIIFESGKDFVVSGGLCIYGAESTVEVNSGALIINGWIDGPAERIIANGGIVLNLLEYTEIDSVLKLIKVLDYSNYNTSNYYRVTSSIELPGRRWITINDWITLEFEPGAQLTIPEDTTLYNFGYLNTQSTIWANGLFYNEGTINLVNDGEIKGNAPSDGITRVLKVAANSEDELRQVLSRYEDYDSVYADVGSYETYEKIIIDINSDLVIPENACVEFFGQNCGFNIKEGNKLLIYGVIWNQAENFDIYLGINTIAAVYGWSNFDIGATVSGDGTFIDYSSGFISVGSSDELKTVLELAGDGYTTIQIDNNTVLSEDAEIRSNISLIVADGVTLSLENGCVLVNNGSINIPGILDIGDGCAVENNGIITTPGAVSDHITGAGSINGNDPVSELVISFSDIDGLKNAVQTALDNPDKIVCAEAETGTIELSEELTIPGNMTVRVSGDAFINVNCDLTVDGEFLVFDNAYISDFDSCITINGYTNLWLNDAQHFNCSAPFIWNVGIGTQRIQSGTRVTFIPDEDGWYVFSSADGDVYFENQGSWGSEYIGDRTVKLELEGGEPVNLFIGCYRGEGIEVPLTVSKVTPSADYSVASGEVYEDSQRLCLDVTFSAPDNGETYYVAAAFAKDEEYFDKCLEDPYGAGFAGFKVAGEFNTLASDETVTIQVDGLFPGEKLYYAAVIVTGDLENPQVEACETTCHAFDVPGADYPEYDGMVTVGSGRNKTVKYTAPEPGLYAVSCSGNGEISVSSRNNVGLASGWDNGSGTVDVVFSVTEENEEFLVNVSAWSFCSVDIYRVESLQTGTAGLSAGRVYSYTGIEGRSVSLKLTDSQADSGIFVCRGETVDQQALFQYLGSSAQLYFESDETILLKTPDFQYVEIKDQTGVMASMIRVYPVPVTDADDPLHNMFKPIDSEGNIIDAPNAFTDNWAYFGEKIDKKAIPDSYGVVALAFDSTGEIVPLSGSKAFKWTVSDSKIASVKADKNYSEYATVTLKAGADGACTVFATTNDKQKEEGGTSIYVMDKTPRLENSTVTLNVNMPDGVQTHIYPSYGKKFTDVLLCEYNAKTTDTPSADNIDYWYVQYNDTLTVQPKSGTAYKGTYKYRVFVMYEGDGYFSPTDLVLSVKTVSTMPAVTIKQTGKVYLDCPDSTAIITISSKTARILGAEFTEPDKISFEIKEQYSMYDGSYVLQVKVKSTNPEDPDYYLINNKMVSKGNLAISFEGYGDNAVEKTVTVAYESGLKSVKMDTASMVLNTKYPPDAVVYACFVRPEGDPAFKFTGVDIEPPKGDWPEGVEVEPLLQSICGVEGEVEERGYCGIQAKFTDRQNCKKGSYSFKVTPYYSNGIQLKPISMKLSITDAQPKVTISSSGKIDCLDTGIGISYTVKAQNIPPYVKTVWLTGTDAGLFTAQVGEADNVMNVYYDDTSSWILAEKLDPKKSYKVTLNFKLEGCDTVFTSAQTIKPVQSKMKVEAEQKSISIFQSKDRDAEVVFKINTVSPEYAGITEIELGSVPALLSKSLVNEADNIWFENFGYYALVHVVIRDTSKLSAGKSYSLPVVIYPWTVAEKADPVKLNLTLKVFK